MTEFEKIYSAYFSEVYHYACRLTGDGKTAEEVTSDTFFKAMNSLDSFRGECGVGTWLCGIARNTWYSRCRKQGRELPLTDELPDGGSLEESLVDKSEAERIQIVLHGLKEPYKEVFMWRVFGEKSFKEIGAIFGKTDNWACVTYHRARAMIISRLEGGNE